MVCNCLLVLDADKKCQKQASFKIPRDGRNISKKDEKRLKNILPAGASIVGFLWHDWHKYETN